MQGKIKHYNGDKGYGFIVGTDTQDYFFHISNFKSGILPTQGMLVSFTSAKNEKGNVADDIEVVQDGHPFISLNGHDIKKSNIKNYGISQEYRYYQRIYTLVKEKNEYEGGKVKILFKELLYGTHTFSYVKTKKMYRISQDRFNRVVGNNGSVHHVLDARQGEIIGWQGDEDDDVDTEIVAPFTGFIDLNRNDFDWELTKRNDRIDKSDVMRRQEKFIYITTYQGDNFKFYENQIAGPLEERLNQLKIELSR
ncbi:cold shock domain-containing protein [Exiguobacterium profundum]|uniref:cold-shock protein n=1 Tax=Exiguobacterium profundum TaxID=307643 RepID=UPI00339AA8E0